MWKRDWIPTVAVHSRGAVPRCHILESRKDVRLTGEGIRALVESRINYVKEGKDSDRVVIVEG